jgi:hypothetical protein
LLEESEVELLLSDDPLSVLEELDVREEPLRLSVL